ncbi:hypothetical protein WJX81_006334 [Elliptochloris bilobata]|uniref:phytol kinase n=1 Tax=Elliptochloris bilobata TaxID=381761 RepID=A0AAW1QMU7_9CHLO
MDVLSRSLAAWLVTAGGCAALIASLRFFVRARAVGETLSRKLLHTGCGLLYLLCWPLYDLRWPWSPVLCASAPALATLHFLLVGLGLQSDPELVKSFTRRGERSELLLGPAPYGCIHVAATLAYWQGAPAGVLVIAVLCAGDGLADILGRRMGQSNKWAHNRDKSRAGTLAFFIGAALAAFAALEFAAAKGLVSHRLSRLT